MSGLLQRLAARATGSAWTLHSDARLPFAGGTLAMAETADMAPAAPPDPANSPATVVARRTEPPASDAPREPAPIAAHTPHRPAMPGHAATAAIQPAHETRVTARAADEPVEHSIQNDTVHAAQSAPTDAAWVSTAPPRAVHPTVHADPPPLLPNHRSDGSAAARPATAHATAASVTPRPPHALPTLRQPASAAARPVEPTEVHVHIGRIEVTAVQAPQTAQRPVRERTQPLSLDAYLAKRKEPS